MAEPKVMTIGNLSPPRKNMKEPQEGIVVSVDGVSPTILATCYKGTMPKIVVYE